LQLADQIAPRSRPCANPTTSHLCCWSADAYGMCAANDHERIGGIPTRPSSLVAQSYRFLIEKSPWPSWMAASPVVVAFALLFNMPLGTQHHNHKGPEGLDSISNWTHPVCLVRSNRPMSRLGHWRVVGGLPSDHTPGSGIVAWVRVFRAPQISDCRGAGPRFDWLALGPVLQSVAWGEGRSATRKDRTAQGGSLENL